MVVKENQNGEMTGMHIYVLIASGVGLAFFSFMLITIILGNWFYKNLGTFSGIAIAFSGIGSAIASPIITKMLEIHGYQKVYTMYIIIIILMVVPILFVPFWPQDMGLNPYGEGMVVENKKVKVEKNLDLPYKLISAMAIVLFAMTVFIMAGTALNSHLPSLALDNGFSADTGALYDLTGSYQVPLLLGIAMEALTLVLIFWLIGRIRKQKKGTN